MRRDKVLRDKKRSDTKPAKGNFQLINSQIEGASEQQLERFTVRFKIDKLRRPICMWQEG